MTVLFRPQRLPSRSAFVAGLLVLTLGLFGVLAYQAVDATRSHQRMAEKTLTEHASFAAWELSSAIRRELFSQFLAPGFELVAKLGGAYPGVSLKGEEALEKLAQDFGWWPGLGNLDYIFRYSPATGEFAAQGEEMPSGATQEWLQGLVEERAGSQTGNKKVFPWAMVFHGIGEEQRIVALAVDPDPETGELVGFGFQTTTAALNQLFEVIEMKVPLLPPALTRGKPSNQLLSFGVATRTNPNLYRSSPQYPSTYSAGDTVGAIYGDLHVKVALRPEVVESLIIGGLPRSRLPVIFGLLALAAALVVAAIFQIRREQELSLLRTDFVSSVSHQLRTPLAQIRMFGETLLLGRVRSEEERQRSLEIIVRESQRLTHQVDNVLLFSRAQRNDVRLNPVETPLAPLIREVLESFCPLAEAEECRVESLLDEDLSATVDPASVGQILLNLLENAVKYGPKDQIVDVKLQAGSPGRVRLVVEDEGEGIPEDQREAVFTPYARLDRDRDSGVAGSGIGLAVVRELVRRQGGSVWAENAMSGGARLVVELPTCTEAP
jgi:signal transduction histidine kinase